MSIRRRRPAGEHELSTRASLQRPLTGVFLLLLAGVTLWTLRSWRGAEPAARPADQANKPTPGFAATVPAVTTAPEPAPPGMVWIPGGEFSMGAADPRSVEHGGHESMADARPIHRVYVDPFWVDATEATNQEFAGLVKATASVPVRGKKP